MVTTEERMTRLETAFETTLPHLATKEDIAKLEGKIAWGTVTILVALAAILVKLFA